MVACLAVGLVCSVSGQEQLGSLRLEVHTGTDPVADAEVVAGGTAHLTDKQGIAIIPTSAGPGQLTVLREGFLPVTVPVDVVAGQERVVRIELVRQPDLEMGKRDENRPIRAPVTRAMTGGHYQTSDPSRMP